MRAWAARSPTRSSRRSRATIVCGAANNQLAHPGVEKALEERGILYAPDYCVNAGGLIQVADELEGFTFDRAQQRATGIFDTTLRVFELAESDGIPPGVAADRLAERRIARSGRLRGMWLQLRQLTDSPVHRGNWLTASARLATPENRGVTGRAGEHR